MLNCFDTMDEPWGYYANCNKTEKYKYYMISFICGTWKIKQTSKQNQIHKYIEQIGGYQRAGGLNKLSHFSYVWLFVTLWTVAQPGSSVHGILQARILEWVSMPFSKGIFLTLGSNLCLLHLLHWQADSLPLAPPGKPRDIAGGQNWWRGSKGTNYHL